MDPFQNPYMSLPGVTPEELGFLQQATTGLKDENQQKIFFYGIRQQTQKPAGYADILPTWNFPYTRVATLYRRPGWYGHIVPVYGWLMLYWFDN